MVIFHCYVSSPEGTWSSSYQLEAASYDQVPWIPMSFPLGTASCVLHHGTSFQNDDAMSPAERATDLTQDIRVNLPPQQKSWDGLLLKTMRLIGLYTQNELWIMFLMALYWDGLPVIASQNNETPWSPKAFRTLWHLATVRKRWAATSVVSFVY